MKAVYGEWGGVGCGDVRLKVGDPGLCVVRGESDSPDWCMIERIRTSDLSGDLKADAQLNYMTR
jgi:hypothetical protein